METEENANIDGEENPKKRKNQPVAENNSSDDEFEPPQIEDPVLISNLINNANEANMKTRELERLMQAQEAKLRILARGCINS